MGGDARRARPFAYELRDGPADGTRTIPVFEPRFPLPPAKHGLPVNLLCWGILDKRAAAHPATPAIRFIVYRPSRPAAAPARPPVPAGRFGPIFPKLARLGSIQERKGEDQRLPCTMFAPTVPIRRYLGAGTAGHRCVRAGSLHVGHRPGRGRSACWTYEQGVTPVPRHQTPGPRNDKAALHGRNVCRKSISGSATVPIRAAPQSDGIAQETSHGAAHR